MDGAGAELVRLIRARARPVSPTLAPVAFPQKAAKSTARSAAAAAAAAAPSPAPPPDIEGGGSSGGSGAGAYGSEAEMLALLRPRSPAEGGEAGAFFSAAAFMCFPTITST